MGKKKDVPPAVKAMVLLRLASGRTVKQTASEFAIDMSTVYYIKRKYKKGTLESRRHNCRGNSVVGPRTLHRIRRGVVEDPFITARELREQLMHGEPKVPSERTIQRVLATTLRMPARRPAKKPLLSAAQRKARLQFCKAHAQWTEEQWMHVLFSDESTFRQYGSDKVVVRRPEGKRFEFRYTVPTVKHSVSVMVWGCFAAEGVGELYFLPERITMNAANYEMVLESCLRRNKIIG